ncbi:hypothetical protein [Aeromonas enteropelogenes]|uniref:hypothetical protein n=1 Tax=Aeromonas enteropelogenes TaxID=29489 RepID=UPI002285A2C1|nr:hypothetical protein [Aeromonas enteropelogenes]MCZ0750092.1 hypothetical protein [Aeromonas enteropelogenes]
MNETKNLISSIPSGFFSNPEHKPWQIINTFSHQGIKHHNNDPLYKPVAFRNNTLRVQIHPELSNLKTKPIKIVEGVFIDNDDEHLDGTQRTDSLPLAIESIGAFFVPKGNETTHNDDYITNSFLATKNSVYSTDNAKFNPESGDKEINIMAELIFTQLKDERYNSGELSIVDYRIESLLHENGLDYILRLMNKLAVMCYSSKLEMVYAHYLNVLKNLTYHSNDDILKTNVLAALSHRSTIIKEAAIAIFEGWKYQSKNEITQMIDLLENIDVDHVDWLNEYRNMVIRDLKEEFGAN